MSVPNEVGFYQPTFGPRTSRRLPRATALGYRRTVYWCVLTPRFGKRRIEGDCQVRWLGERVAASYWVGFHWTLAEELAKQDVYTLWGRMRYSFGFLSL